MRTFLSSVVLLLTLARPAFADEPPALKLASAVFVAGMSMDIISTQMCLSKGGIEGNPLFSRMNNNPVAVGLGGVALDTATLLIARRVGMHHPKIAAAVLFGAGAMLASYGAHNLSIYQELSARRRHTIYITVPVGR